MKIVDANVLLYAANADARQHTTAVDWLTEALRTETVGFPWVSLLAFVRIATNPRISERPLLPNEAFDLVQSWLICPGAVTVEPTVRHVSVLRGLVEQAGTGGNLTTDAHLAALAIEHSAQIVTFDRDFPRFGARCQLLS